jgi:hypothetical protein
VPQAAEKLKQSGQAATIDINAEREKYEQQEKDKQKPLAMMVRAPHTLFTAARVGAGKATSAASRSSLVAVAPPDVEIPECHCACRVVLRARLWPNVWDFVLCDFASKAAHEMTRTAFC